MLKVGRKTITTLQDGGVYKESWTAGLDLFPAFNASAVTEFFDSAGGLILSIDGAVTDREVTFLEQPDTMVVVPNGAGFRVIITDDEGPHVIRYGTVFRRELFFPNSPAEVLSFEPKRYSDTFQRPPGILGGRWKNLLSRCLIFDNAGSLPNSVGPDFDSFSRYFSRYYQGFSGDTVELSISMLDKGAGTTIIPISCNSDATSYLYADFVSVTAHPPTTSTVYTVHLGLGTDKDIQKSGALQPQTSPATLTIPLNTVVNFKLIYDDATKELALYNSDKTTQYLSWVDDSDLVPHGKGYRYFGIGGKCGAKSSGVQLTYISAANIV